MPAPTLGCDGCSFPELHLFSAVHGDRKAWSADLSPAGTRERVKYGEHISGRLAISCGLSLHCALGFWPYYDLAVGSDAVEV